MKPDWCDEATWERAWDMWQDEELDDGPTLIARALIAAKNEGLEEAVSAVAQYADHPTELGQFLATEMMDAIRSRIQKE